MNISESAFSLSENLTKGNLSSSQSTLDYINSWVSGNWMRLNVNKCKELRLCFFKEKTQFSHKVLRLIIQNDLKRNEHIASMVAKASKRLHILRVLRRGGVPAADLVSIYVCLIHSILEYSCEDWHYALPFYLSEQPARKNPDTSFWYYLSQTNLQHVNLLNAQGWTFAALIFVLEL